jgi:hypothetical protein
MPNTQIQKVFVDRQIVEPNVIQKLYKQAETLTTEAKALKVTDYKSSDEANLLASRINRGKKKIDEARKHINADSQTFIKTINNLVKPITQMCDDALNYLDKQRSAFRITEQKKLAEEKAKQAAEEARRQKISMARGGDGSNIKPVEQPVDKLAHRSTDAVRRIPDREKIQTAINEAVKRAEVKFPLQIPGIEIFAEWKFKIYDSQGVPDEWKKDSFVDR